MRGGERRREEKRGEERRRGERNYIRIGNIRVEMRGKGK